MEHEPYLQEIKETIEQIRSLLPERGHYSTQQRILNLIDKVGSAAKIYAKPEIFNLGEALAAMVQTKGTGGAAPIISRKKGLELFDLVLLYWEEPFFF